MKTSDLFYLSFQAFKNRKSRVLFTVLGVAVGIGAILFLVSFGYGLQQNLLEKITTEESLLSLDVIPPESGLVSLTEQSLVQIKAIDGVEKVSPQAIYPAQLSLADLNSETSVNLIDSDFFSLEGLDPEIGQNFTEKDIQKVVINSSVAKLFNLEPAEMMGRKVKFTIFIPQEEEADEQIKIFQSAKEIEVVGVILDEANSSQAYIALKDLPDLAVQEYRLAKVKVRRDEIREAVREQLLSMGFLVSALSDTITQANQIFRVIQIVLGIFGVVALIVAAIGLINTMTITLLERTNEIGIMRAIGASPRDVQKLFLSESLIIGFLGGLSGIALGVVAAEIFNWMINVLASSLGGQGSDLFVYPSWFILFIISVSTLVGLIAGIWPARRAGSLNPLSALRYK